MNLITRRCLFNSISNWLLLLAVSFWLFSRSKPALDPQKSSSTPQNSIISSELVSISGRLSYIWISTRDTILRKCSLSSNYRYGLQFQINNNLHLLLWILLSGDVAVNPGPGSKYFRCLSFNAQSIRSTTKLPDETYNDAHSHHPSLCSDLPSGLRITQWNLRSLAPRINNTKLGEIKLILKDPGSETHILGVTESWLDESIDDTRIKINGYTH